MKALVTSIMGKMATDYLNKLTELFGCLELDALDRVLQSLSEARKQGSTIYIAGNGGSAATATHWVNDLGKATKCSERPPVRVMSLSDNLSWMTALANDEGYERVFSGQLDNFASAGDVLVVISASGNSANLLRAVELAKTRGVRTIGFLGFDGGILKDMVNDYILAPTEQGAYELVEDCHVVICHLLTIGLLQEGTEDAGQ